MPNSSNPKADRCCQRLQWRDLNLAPIRALIEIAKEEDLEAGGIAGGTKTPGDHSAALLPAGQTVCATLRAREPMTACGLQLAPLVVAAYHPDIVFTSHVEDGENLSRNDSLGALTGPVQSVLSAERPLLNFLQKLSGVATTTQRYTDALAGSPTRLLDTRKTTPGYRVLEKYAVACGRGWNHRIGLYDRIMLKDNHLAAFGKDQRSAAIKATQASRAQNPDLLVEMEVDTLEQIDMALAASVDIILLDNFTPDELRQAVSKIGQQAVTEASGGITLDALPELGAIGLDFISTGALVHKSVWVDIGLDWD